MNRNKSLIFSILCCIIFIGCSTKPNELNMAEEIMNSKPDSALKLLKIINIERLHDKPNSALNSLLLSQNFYKKYRIIENDSLISIANNYFDETDFVHAGYVWFYHAQIAAYLDSINEQAWNLLKASEDARKIFDKNFSVPVNYDLATMHFNQRQFNYSILFFKKAIDYYRHTNKLKSEILSNFYIGYCYLYLSKIDSAKFYYKQVEDIDKKTNNKVLISTILRNIGTVYFQHANYIEALRYFYSVPLTGNIIFDSNKYTMIANVHIKTNRLDSARYYLLKVNDLHEKAPDYFRLWQAIATKENDKINALYFANKVRLITDSNNMKKLETSLMGFEKKYYYEGLQIANQRLIIKNKQQSLYLLISVLILTVFITLFLFWRLKVKKQEVKYQTELAYKKQELLVKEEENLVKMIENSALLERQLKLQNILLSNIRMHQLNTVKRPIVWREGSKETIDKQYVTFYNELKTYVDIEFNNFTTRFKKKHPSLTENDMFISCLLIAKFDTGMIATILNVQADTVNKQRYRLRTKLKLEKSENLLGYLLHF